ncbi:hypothetical protein ACEWY4_012287 [Coilia grayii]|uniref:Transmembrane protein 132C n=1 Tax=Coilia grayii TaxID=363190 RepID=A0ABD1K027_9TELE
MPAVIATTTATAAAAAAAVTGSQQCHRHLVLLEALSCATPASGRQATSFSLRQLLIVQPLGCSAAASVVVMGAICLAVDSHDPRGFWEIESARDSDDEDEDERGRGRSCTLQYQNAMLRVLTHFVAESAEPRGQLTYMLGSDWHVDITGLVWDFLKVEDPRVVRLQEGRRLVGLDTGMTAIQQVLSPLSDSILAERTVRVLEERVSITELGLQLVSSLSLSLQLSPGSNRAVLATATTQEELSNLKQEALISVWLQFSDGSAAPLDLYDPGTFQLSAVSLDESVLQVQTQTQTQRSLGNSGSGTGGVGILAGTDMASSSTHRWPIIVAQAEGQGMLLRAELSVPETCQRYKPRRATLATGTCHVQVRFGPPEPPEGAEDGGGGRGGRAMNHPPQRRPPSVTSASVRYGSAVSDTSDTVMRRFGTTPTSTTRTDILRRPGGDKLSDDGSQPPIDFADFPAQVDIPRGRNVDGEDDSGLGEEDLLQTPRGLSDLEIGMYALLGVFCLAILVFLINCVSYTLKYPHKELGGEEGPEGGAAGPHAHDWVWLGSEAAEFGLSHRDDDSSLSVMVMDSNLGALEEGSQLLNGGGVGGMGVAGLQKHIQGQVHRSPDGSVGGGGGDGGGGGKEVKGDSPTSKRKRVKFTTFSTVATAERGSPASESLGSGTGMGGDIQWVCRDVELNDSKELRNYMERLSDGVLRDAV